MAHAGSVAGTRRRLLGRPSVARGAMTATALVLAMRRWPGALGCGERWEGAGIATTVAAR